MLLKKTKGKPSGHFWTCFPSFSGYRRNHEQQQTVLKGKEQRKEWLCIGIYYIRNSKHNYDSALWMAVYFLVNTTKLL